MKYPLVIPIAVITTFASGQKRYLDSLHQLLNDGKQDTASVLALSALADYYGFNQFDSSILYARKTIDLSEKVSYPYGTFLGLRSLCYAYNCQELIQSGKMASLGELTAGIAHEIQNPLNFVNNFSEVNTELIDELENQLNADNKEEAISIAHDIKENEQKINHHGKRADSIVKGMLQHSRSSTGVKEPTDINALAGEYLRLAYHGMTAKDNSFNATLKTDYDESIGNINIIPQGYWKSIAEFILQCILCSK